MHPARPILVVDRGRAERNLARMAAKARAAGVLFRPHFKTHQSAEIGSWFRAHGVEAITVSSLDMAWYFQEQGWRDITLAMVLNPVLIPELNRLAGLVKLGVLADSMEMLDRLGREQENPLRVWLKLDTGYRRTGLDAEDRNELKLAAATLKAWPNLEAAGVLNHCGQAYRCADRAAILELYRENTARLDRVRRLLEDILQCKLLLSVGDTPSCNILTDFAPADEIRPGNFIFNDLMQLANGSCDESDLALAVACPLIGRYPQRAEIVMHGGAVHLSREFIKGRQERPCFGLAARLSAVGWGPLSSAAVASLDPDFGAIPDYGEALAVIPVHACLAVAGVNYYHCLGNGDFPAMNAPAASNR